jgi:hypothetical protein
MNTALENVEDKPITVRLRVDDCPKPLTAARWSDWVDWELAKAGVPIEGCVLMRGTIRRRDDPEDFGATIWEWTP